MKKSQASFEFIITLGIGLTLIAVISAIFFTYINTSKDTLDNKQLTKFFGEIIETTEKIYHLGAGNAVTVKGYFPKNIANISIHHKTNTFAGESVTFDYLNLSVYNAYGSITPLILTTQETYIRFNCTRCAHSPAYNISWYNDSSDYTDGNKRIKITSKGSWVSIDFVKGDEE